MNIVVLAGGLSHEREISLSSGSLVANALTQNGHKVMLLDLYFGYDIVKDEIPALFTSNKIPVYKVNEVVPNLDELKMNDSSLIGKNVIEICKYADIVYLALHGGIGENGQLQAIFDAYNIKYTGSGYEASLLAMNKAISKHLFKANDIPTADWVIYDTKNDNLNDLVNKIKYPAILKPNTNGSSVGVVLVKNESDLSNAIIEAGKYDMTLLIEEFIEGREFSVGVLDKEALPPIEIIPKEGFYDYKNKYQAGLTTEICPANISDDETNLLKKLALQVHNVLGLNIYARIDFIMDKQGNCYCLEANSLPGMTPTSLMPQEAKAFGIDYHSLCNKIIELSYSKKAD